jgi:hypothetical protein
MERKITWLSSALAIGMMIVISGCSKTASAPKPDEEIKGPTETVVLNMVSTSNESKVGSLYIDNMNGRARARIQMDSGYYTQGSNMKANITLTTPSGTVLYANCQDVSGTNGQCSTFPITVLKDNSDALFSKITSTDGLVFNVLDKDNKVYARSTSQTIVINN